MYFCPSSRQKLCINIYYIDFILYIFYIYMIVYMGIIIYVFLYV